MTAVAFMGTGLLHGTRLWPRSSATSWPLLSPAVGHEAMERARRVFLIDKPFLSSVLQAEELVGSNRGDLFAWEEGFVPGEETNKIEPVRWQICCIM